ncbi:MAG: hypothetical protein J6A18_01575, partial [Alistipes sp.]|nr:hypothetical protein [Alistipes sp.]
MNFALNKKGVHEGHLFIIPLPRLGPPARLRRVLQRPAALAVGGIAVYSATALSTACISPL